MVPVKLAFMAIYLPFPFRGVRYGWAVRALLSVAKMECK